MQDKPIFLLVLDYMLHVLFRCLIYCAHTALLLISLFLYNTLPRLTKHTPVSRKTSKLNKRQIIPIMMGIWLMTFLVHLINKTNQIIALIINRIYHEMKCKLKWGNAKNDFIFILWHKNTQLHLVCFKEIWRIACNFLCFSKVINHNQFS